jgi:phage pi2 protein 07
MFYLACTRFNNQTYKENTNYRIKNGESVIYGSAFKTRQIYSVGALIFVTEMNNETNKIEGIGLIKNLLVCDKYYKIYDDNNYNRYIYRGKYWLSREQLDKLDIEISETLNNILFKGKSNMKRMSGITVLTDKLFTNWEYELRDLKNKVKNAFLNYFKHHITFDIETEEVFEIIPKKRNKIMK